MTNKPEVKERVLKNDTEDISSKNSNGNKKKISIAMQGGGAHGAFTWGVLDKLLEDGRFVVDGVTGTSAGGMNAVATIQGLLKGGNQGARNLLKTYWQKTSQAGVNSSLNNCGIIDILLGKYTMYNSPGFLMFDLMSKFLSPYQTNPLNLNPLRDIVEEIFDFDMLRKNHQHKIFLAATHVYTGKIKIFENKDLSANALLATACLPTMFKAVLVNNEYYWDGGFTANPAVYPLIYNCESSDILIIKLNPTHRNRLPMTPVEISDRLNEVGNNESIMREMRSAHFVTELINKGELDSKKHKKCFFHLIENEETFQELGWSSKLNTEWAFLTHLFEEGRKSATRWIEDNFDKVGKKTTFDVKDEFLS